MFIALLLLTAPGFEIEYESTAPPRYEAFVFLATDCPVARLYAHRLGELADRYPQVHFQGVSVNEHDSNDKIAAFQKELHFGLRRRPDLIARFGPTRSPEVFFVVNDVVVYQGRIDDQYMPGANRSHATRADLEEAIQETLAGKIVSVPRTEPAGCLITLAAHSTGDVTFEQVAPVLHRRCAACHRPGEVAPFSLLTYDDTSAWTKMIREVVSQGRMPPWHADPRYGKFANDPSLSADEKSLLLAWIDAGAPRGESEPKPPEFHTGWSIRPGVVLTMAEPFAVPAEGVLDYQEFALDPGFQCDTWVQAVEVRPGNRSVVHHINVYLRPKDAPPRTYYPNSMKDVFFTVLVPGNSVTAWPTGMAKRVPAGWDIVMSVHYQPCGTPQMDQTSIGLQFADPTHVRQQVATRMILHKGFTLAPHSITTLTESWTLEDDYTLHALMPHMHLRGRSMRVEANGEVLLNVPQFDFNWQRRYCLAEPKRLPKGTVVRVTAEYDNTAANPNNPDPAAEVREGEQSTDEMLQLNLDVVRTHENRLARSRIPTGLLATIFIALFVCYFLKPQDRQSLRDTQPM